jgi:hypothetical protein
MLWLKASKETRWKALYVLLIGVAFYGISISMARGAPPTYRLNWLTGVTQWSALFSVIVTVVLAGTGIDTDSTRPGQPVKGGEGSKLFTLSLPVTRARLFWVRTATGVLETAAILALLAAATWLLLSPSLAGNVLDALKTFALVFFVSITAYAISVCLSTVCDEGWRLRVSGLAVAGSWLLHALNRLPRAIDIFQPIGLQSPLVTHQIPWAALITSGVLAAVFFAAALTIIQRRDY